MLDRPLEVHQLAAGEDAVAWWSAGAPTRRNRYVQWYGRLVLTTQRLLFEPDEVWDDAHHDGMTYRPTEVAFAVPLAALRAVDPVAGDRPPRLQITLVDGQQLVFVVVKRSGVVTQWTRDTGERDRAVEVLRRVAGALGARPPTPAPVPLTLVPPVLAAQAEDRKARGRRRARRSLILLAVVTGVLVAGFAVLLRTGDLYENCTEPEGAAVDDLRVVNGECTQAETVVALWAATDECRPAGRTGGACTVADVHCEARLPPPNGNGTRPDGLEVVCRSALDDLGVRFSTPTA